MTNLLRSIVRAVHCRSPHHYFAIDALPLVQTESGKRLVDHLLRHHQRYLAGALDPDLRFRDFHNHVIHVGEGYWGGAPRVAHQWYDRLLRYLRTDRFSDAAHAAGVLSHYFTDSFNPLHTGVSDREAVLHRPIEWSIALSYDSILQAWRQDEMRVVFRLSERPGWLGEAMLHGARFAHRKSTRLLGEYNLELALGRPPRGLSGDLTASMAELFGLAITGWARVLERIGSDAEAVRMSELPSAGSLLATCEAVMRGPAGLLRRQSEYRNERHAVELLYEEFQRLGRLQKHLPQEVDVVHRVVGVFEQERQWKQSQTTRLEIEKPPVTLPFELATRGGQSEAVASSDHFSSDNVDEDPTSGALRRSA